MRSGKYKQGRRYLKQETAKGGLRYCCLGVLCELYQAERVRKKQRKLVVGVATVGACDRVFSFKPPGGEVDDAVTGALPLRVMRWAGMRTQLGDYCGRERAGGAALTIDALTIDNDSRQKSFRRIATIIEKNVDKL